MTVNGTEDVPLEWDAISWRLHEDNVERLRRRIFKAVKEQDLAKVRSLQKMMLRSWSNTLVSVRQVAQRNTGRKTAGIDGEVALTPSARMALAVRVHRSVRTWDPVPVKRVHIAKSNGKLRPLGIPVLMDRCHQNRVKNALEPAWEARFEPRSYGFRPGRSCQDAIEAIYDMCKGRGATRVWTLDADLAAAFDRIDHDHLLAAIGTFPSRDAIRGWLKAGSATAPAQAPGRSSGTAPWLSGTPMILSSAVTPDSRPSRSRHDWPSGWRPGGWPSTRTRRASSRCRQGTTSWGSNVGRYPNGKLLIKPCNAAVRWVKRKLAEQMRRLRGQNASAVLAAINPITRGWASFYRSVVSKQTFTTVDDYLWRLTYKWACRSHPNKPRRWVTKRYFGQFNPFRRNTWVFGDATSGAYLPPLA